jgi:uncharacterized protein YjbI with pentapeptide repeats
MPNSASRREQTCETDVPMANQEDRLWRPEEILRRYASGEREFRQLDIEDSDDGASFRGARLDDADFSGSFLVADFTGTSLRNSCWSNANVKTCIFRDADLSGANFSGAALDATVFQGAKMAGANFTGAYVQGSELQPGEMPDW